MRSRSKHFGAVAIAGLLLAAVAPYAAQAEDAVDPAVVDASLSGAVVTAPPIPPVTVHIGEPEVSEPEIESPEEEDLTEDVNVEDPGPIMPVDPAVIDQMVITSVGAELPNAGDATTPGIQKADDTNGGECTASAAVPVKDKMKIEASGSVTCGTAQRSINLVVCIEYRPAGTWESLTCKPKTHSNTKSTDKKVSTTCVAGRFVYRTVVRVGTTSKNETKTNLPEKTALSGRLFCAS